MVVVARAAVARAKDLSRQRSKGDGMIAQVGGRGFFAKRKQVGQAESRVHSTTLRGLEGRHFDSSSLTVTTAASTARDRCGDHGAHVVGVRPLPYRSRGAQAELRVAREGATILLPGALKERRLDGDDEIWVIQAGTHLDQPAEEDNLGSDCVRRGTRKRESFAAANR
eukprot:1558554-Prymnesium_polylepis.1